MSALKPRGGSRIALFIAGAVLAVVGAVISTTATASAHNPIISASANCSGVVNFTATSWLPPDPYNIPEHRTNPTVEVTYKVNGSGPDIAVTTGAFNPGNNYSFSGQFAWPGDATSIVVTAVATGEWAIGTPGGGSFSTTVLRPDMPCQEESTTTELATTTTEAATTTTAAVTTTTAAVTTTTAKATTTTALGSDGPTTTQLGSDAPATTIARVLPRTGGGNGSLPLVALGLLLIGLSLVLGTRRQIA